MKIFPQNINYLNIFLTICGIKPVFDRRIDGQKYSIIGLIFVAIHMALIIYCDQELKEEQDFLRLVMPSILFAMTYLARIANLGYPLVTLIGAILQFNSVRTFLELEDRFDVYLRMQNVKVHALHRKIKIMELLAVVTVIIVGLISGYSNLEYSRALNPAVDPVDFTTFYHGIFFGVNFTLIVFKICLHYYGLFLRADVYIQHLKGILDRDIQLNHLQFRRY